MISSTGHITNPFTRHKYTNKQPRTKKSFTPIFCVFVYPSTSWKNHSLRKALGQRNTDFLGYNTLDALVHENLFLSSYIPQEEKWKDLAGIELSTILHTLPLHRHISLCLYFFYIYAFINEIMTSQKELG